MTDAPVIDTAVLDVEGLRVWFHQRGGLLKPRIDLKAVDGVAVRIERGDTLGLVGESGSGKTTMARAVLALQRPTEGTIRFHGSDINSLQRVQLRAVRKRIQLVQQDALGSLNPLRTLGATLAEPLRIHDLVPKAERAGRVGELLESVGLPAGMARRYPHELSGGQLKRVCIARALATEPELIVADEPTSGLDVSVQAKILNLLKELQQRLDLAILLISHDLSVVRYMCDRVAVMYFGRIVEVGSRDQVFGDPQHPYTRALLAAAPNMASLATGVRPSPIGGEVPALANPPKGCAFHPRCPDVFERCFEAEPALANTSAGGRAACFLAGSPAIEIGSPQQGNETGSPREESPA